MTIKRALRFLGLMAFIFAVAVLLARSSILELRARAEKQFVEERLNYLREVASGKEYPEKAQVYFINREELKTYSVDSKAERPLPYGDILDSLTPEAGGFRSGSHFWVYLPLQNGRFLVSRTPYAEVISWTRGFENKEIRNVILVIVAFGVITLVWMWADRRALIAAQKAEMVERLERMVQERTEALNRMDRMAKLGEFAASLAHEIRNPLGSLVTSAKLLPDATEEEKKDLVGVIKRESSRLDRVLADFLLFSKDPQLRIRKVPLNSLLEKSLEGLKKSEDFDGIKLIYRWDPSVKEVSCDPDQMDQVFWNLALNGAQAMEGSGRLYVSTRLNGKWAEISFRDEGPGMPREDTGKIFEPFFTRKKKGTGLGLSIASRVVEAHKGFIQVSSEKGRGTVFTVSLPADGQRDFDS